MDKKGCAVIIVLALVILAIVNLLFVWAWNFAVTGIFDVRAITFFEGLAFMTVLSIIGSLIYGGNKR